MFSFKKTLLHIYHVKVFLNLAQGFLFHFSIINTLAMINWFKEEEITKILVAKYNVCPSKIMKKKIRHQLITLMAPDEVESEINLLSKKYFRYSSKEVSYLRDVLKQHVNNLIRRKRPSGAYSFLLLHKKIINYSNLLSYINLLLYI